MRSLKVLVTSTLLLTACKDAVGPKDTASLRGELTADVRTLDAGFNTNAVLNNDLVVEGSPITYVVDFAVGFSSISEVDFLFTFGNDPLDPGECLEFTGEFIGGFGVCNSGTTPQTSKPLNFPCSLFSDLCDGYHDGVSTGQMTASRFAGSGSASVRITSATVTVHGTVAGNLSASLTAQGRYLPGLFDQAGFASIGQGQAGWLSFDIRQLAGSRVCGTTLRFTQAGTTNPNAFPVSINIYDVSTSFDRLIVDRIPIDAEGEAIASDLHTGKVYASFQVTAAGEGTVYEIALNDLGLADLQAAISGGELTFSIGLANASFDALGYFSPENVILSVSVGCVLEVPIDIKPQSCPNSLSSKDRGVIPVAILGSSAFDVTHVDASTLTLEGVPALRSALEDVASPFAGNLENFNSCTRLGPDGFVDLTVKFDAQLLVAALGGVTDGEARKIEIDGNLKVEFGGTAITGVEIVRLVVKP